MIRLLTLIVGALLMSCAQPPPSESARASTPQFKAADEARRMIVLVSDLHLGMGRDAKGHWMAGEDFRWHDAFVGFLSAISKLGKTSVDLVILGDFLEMWQAPPSLKCQALATDVGCTVEELEAISRHVVTQHASTLGALRLFSQQGTNRVHVVPGNHDAGLLLARVWSPVAVALEAHSGRIQFVSSGVWVSSDGQIVAEHGHQIGSDVNKFSDWPDVTARRGSHELMIKPWGENFVQKIFNAEEEQYPIIDNVSPEASGARFRMEDRGVWGSIADMARFIKFNLLETNYSQKAYFLGPPTASKPEWDLAVGRKLGYELVTNALPQNDPFRLALLADNTAAIDLREALTALLRDTRTTSDDEIRLLCDHAAIQQGPKRCERPQLGMLLERTLIPREAVVNSHLELRLKAYGSMRIFVYGHTHLLEEEWTTTVRGERLAMSISVLNTGAFQRVIDEKGFINRASAMGITAGEGLRRLQLEELPPCYSAVFVTYEEGTPRPITRQWFMAEGSSGELIAAGDPRCR